MQQETNASFFFRSSFVVVVVVIFVLVTFRRSENERSIQFLVRYILASQTTVHLLHLYLIEMFPWLASTKDDDTDSSVEGPDVTTTSTSQSTPCTTTVETTTPTPQSKRRTWKTAFRDTCLQNGTIHASIVQVLEQQASVDASEIPTASTGFYFHQDGANEKLVQRFQSEYPNSQGLKNEESEAAAKSSSSSAISYVFDKAVSVTKYAAKFVLQSEDDIAMEQHGIDMNGSSKDEDQVGENQALDESEPLLNMDLAVECLLFLRDVIARHASSTNKNNEQDSSILPLPGGAPTATAVCQGWISRILEKDACGQEKIRTLVRRMAPKDLEFLLQALMACRVVEIVHRRPRQDDLLVFLPGQEHSAKEVKLAMFDLVRQINLIQIRMDTLTARKEKCTQDALRCRKNKHERQAMQHMKLRQKLEEDIGLCYGKMHNLEDQRAALENATSNREILQVSQQTAKTLKNIRQETENADEILLELQDEIDANNVIQDTLSHTIDSSAVVVDEDELLAELEALNIDDAPGGSDPGALEQPGQGASVFPFPPKGTVSSVQAGFSRGESGGEWSTATRRAKDAC